MDSILFRSSIRRKPFPIHIILSYLWKWTGRWRWREGGEGGGIFVFVEYVIHSTNTMKSVKYKQWFMLLHRLRISFLQLNPQWTRIIRLLGYHCFWLGVFILFVSFQSQFFSTSRIQQRHIHPPCTQPSKKRDITKRKNQIVIVLVSWWAFNRQIAGLSALS